MLWKTEVAGDAVSTQECLTQFQSTYASWYPHEKNTNLAFDRIVKKLNSVVPKW